MAATDTALRPLAVVTGASSGIGFALARELAAHDFDLVVAADDAAIDDAAQMLRTTGAGADPVRADLATSDGVEQLVARTEADGRGVAALVINAGVGVAGPFVETDVQDHLRLVDLNVRGAVELASRVLPAMVERGQGRVLFTSSIAATMPGPYMSTYNASKAFLYSFAQALRTELKESGVTVTALMPGPTDTRFFERADMEDTKLGHSDKDDPADVARDGYEAMMAGKDHVIAGSLKNKAQVAAAKVLPDTALAKTHAKMSEPGSGK
ncbi:MAG TPA: SDR family NAD(P)-dependent oxidoreductase [Acidimicrobiia bacterium]|nr:SDR family NAD(P)-dependent oxidoreductase [Acidimicrobiia bacterium]